jgi:hypothetical protein
MYQNNIYLYHIFKQLNFIIQLRKSNYQYHNISYHSILFRVVLLKLQ